MQRGLAIVIACALAGCASDDGLLVAIDVDYETVFPDDVAEIDLWVGVPADANDPTAFVRVEIPGLTDRRAVDGWPFRALIYADDAGARPVWIGAFGFESSGSNRPVAEGAIAGPVLIAPGELAVRHLRLSATSRATGDCVFQPADPDDGTGPLVIRPPDADLDALDCDGDGYDAGQDCNDLDATTNAGARERCDGLDNDCDGFCDEVDLDSDQYNPCTYDGGCTVACADGSAVPPEIVGGCDCDETDAGVHPGATESDVCDGEDSNCDGIAGGAPTGVEEEAGNHIDDDCDGDCDVDADGDLITGPDTVPGTWVTTCDPVRPDCNDDNPDIYPNALEACDGVDSDCDQVVTVIAQRPCFTRTVDGCMHGDRSCGEVAGGGILWDTCTPLGTVVHDEVCSKWGLVEATPWPERTLFEGSSAEERAACTLDVWRPGGANEVCTNPRTSLNNRVEGDVPCETFIADRGGGGPGWSIKLSTRGDSPITGTSVPSCDVDLVVEAVRGEGQSDVRLPSLWLVIVQQELDPVTMVPVDAELVPVEIVPHYADASTAFVCPFGPSLSCDEP